MPSLSLGSRRIEYAVVKGNSRRYTYFHFRPDLTLEVVVPRGRPVNVEEAIKERATWLVREYDRASRTQRVLGDGTVMFGGNHLRVVFKDGPEQEVVADMATGQVTVQTDDRRRLRELVRRWYLRESSAYAVRKVTDLAPRLGVKPLRVDVREISKWGYCTREGRLSFSWQLAALPDRLREYVVLHELTHLLEFNHSPAFRRRLAAFCPDFREREKELDLVVPYNKLALG